MKGDLAIVKDSSQTQLNADSDDLFNDPQDSIGTLKRSGTRDGSKSSRLSSPEGGISHKDSIENLNQHIDYDSNSISQRIPAREGGQSKLRLDVTPFTDGNLKQRNQSESQEMPEERKQTLKNIVENSSSSSSIQQRSSRPRRTSKPVERFSDEYSRYYLMEVDFGLGSASTGSLYLSSSKGSDDFTFDEILQHPKKDNWIKAAVLEIGGLEDKDTWVEEDIALATSRVLPGTWIFKLKRRPDGSVKKY